MKIVQNRVVGVKLCVNLIEKILRKKAIKKFMPVQMGDAVKTHSDLKKTKKILNYKPNVTLQQGLINFINWFKIYHKLN